VAAPRVLFRLRDRRRPWHDTRHAGIDEDGAQNVARGRTGARLMPIVPRRKRFARAQQPAGQRLHDHDADIVLAAERKNLLLIARQGLDGPIFRRRIRQQVIAERVVGHHHGVDRAAGDQSSHVLR
jgi:hypothetical protein